MQVVWEVGGSRAAAWGAGCVAVCSAPRSSSAMWLVQVLLPASKCKTEGRGPTCQSACLLQNPVAGVCT